MDSQVLTSQATRPFSWQQNFQKTSIQILQPAHCGLELHNSIVAIPNNKEVTAVKSQTTTLIRISKSRMSTAFSFLEEDCTSTNCRWNMQTLKCTRNFHERVTSIDERHSSDSKWSSRFRQSWQALPFRNERNPSTNSSLIWKKRRKHRISTLLRHFGCQFETYGNLATRHLRYKRQHRAILETIVTFISETGCNRGIFKKFRACPVI